MSPEQVEDHWLKESGPHEERSAQHGECGEELPTRAGAQCPRQRCGEQHHHSVCQRRQEAGADDGGAEELLHRACRNGDEWRELHAQEIQMISHREVEQRVAMAAEAWRRDGVERERDAGEHEDGGGGGSFGRRLR
jgi:hypothetical protein